MGEFSRRWQRRCPTNRQFGKVGAIFRGWAKGRGWQPFSTVSSGVFLGCGALHLYGPHLSEVRSIVVKPEAKGQGAGGRILGALIDEAEEHGIQSVCLFTRIPDFFFKFGFRTVEDKSDLPDKIFKDCQSCPRLHRCDEVAMVRGRLPRISILGPRHEAQELVRISG